MANKKYLDLVSLKDYHLKLKPVIESKANSSEVYNKNDVYNKSEVDSALDSKSDVGHTHDQYITEQNVYTKDQVDAALESKSDISHTHDQYLTDIGIDISFDGSDTLKGTATDYKILGVDGTKTYYLSGTKFIGPRCTHITITPIIATSANCTYDEKTGIVSWTIYGTSSSGPVSANLSWIGAPGVLTSTKDGTENIIGYFNTVNGQSIVSNEGISDILLDFVGTSDYDHDVTLLCDNPESFFINNSTGEHETGWSNFINGLGFTKNTGTYSKPSGGIPKTDLDSSVQESLNKADTAIQDISGKANLDGGNTFSGLQSINAPTNVSGSEQTNMKIKTSNGGSIAFGKEGQNSGTMIRLDQKDGTCRLRFRSSATAGAMVWEQPEQGAQLYIDLGKDGADKHRIKFPSSAGTLALKSQIPAVNNGTLTIQKNGTNVQTFTANQSGNVTANITVPTKTSELTNDSGFLTSHQDISGKADKSNTLSGYGITDAYTKTEVDNALNTKANASNVYTKTETNNLINSRTKTVVFDTYDKFIQFLEDTSQATYDYFNVGDSIYIKEEGSDYWISGKENIVEGGYSYNRIISGTTGSSLMGTDNIFRTTVTENIGTAYTSVEPYDVRPLNEAGYSNFSWNSSTGDVTITLESLRPSTYVTVTLKCYTPASGGGDYGYYYISNIGPTIPTVGDGMLILQKNGVQQGTFKANATTNTTLNITVPTKTSELTNDSGYLTKVASVLDYGDTSNTIKIGYRGNGLTASQIAYIAGYSVDDPNNPTEHKIKDISKDVLKSWLGYAEVSTGMFSYGSTWTATSGYVWIIYPYDSSANTFTFTYGSGDRTGYGFAILQGEGCIRYFSSTTQLTRYSTSRITFSTQMRYIKFKM